MIRSSEPDADAQLASEAELDDENRCASCGARADQDCAEDCNCEDCAYRRQKAGAA